MEVYERIKARRKELNLSADDVATALGVSRATIYRYESADIEKLPTQILIPLSSVLRCSPSWLMGWDDKVSFDISPVEKEIICKYRALSDDAKDMLLRSLGIERKKESEESCAG
ncbi:MAG: helix-turn-helix domain-containing protein [Lachnospiraceae bacterium]|jgi:transcriptional regulator with XRE-family HTH domain|nr:helix-turn-helix domain-containing protein [Lachnospiraceae bacterium]